MATPTRQTPEQQLDRWNDQFRQSAVYQDFMVRNGLPTNGRVSLSRQQQSALESAMKAAGIQVPSGMHIDQGGNLNQENKLMRNIGIGAAVGGAALTGLGAAGIGPLSGAFGGSAAASGAGAAGVLPSSSLPVASLMGGPAAIASQGISGTVAGLGGAAAGGLGGAAAAGGKGIGSALAGAGKNALGNLMTPQGMLSLAPLIASLANRGGGDSGGGVDNAFLKQAYDDAQGIKQAQLARYNRTDPLHQMVTQLAEDRLPISARRGVRG